MNTVSHILAGARLELRGSGALWWPDARLLCVSDLHLGKAERLARRGGGLLPPYECAETLERLDAEISALSPAVVICLGDSFDDLVAADSLDPSHGQWLARMMAGRNWIWITGNHDPGPISLPGQILGSYCAAPLIFRHIAEPDAEPGEVSGHYHPKARLGGLRRPCFLADRRRLILPAFGTYTGGLNAATPDLAALMDASALAVLTGPTRAVLPLAAC
ncbi:ligase-associated DNA damage response endonuclease PdeM [Tropicimonas sp. TH_r6]|uniref:ligase-associated DNA damage response endonuclease PdeM n=1 Tax=Tropicimonas sp. TH_r6 TaxID=3082085 RepID=UPI0029547488|nr:ligase-associated DNA damage response endonuclease PdeM [Tropicimonas sp. TH_r6]MDV7145511.1 ligase-associated DNA damage response endonuclease PdeM [Tropicimonas sp. TH_r6]